MTARLLDGKALAEITRRDVARGVEAFKAARGVTPALAVILVGDDPASRIYVRNKEKACADVGMRGVVVRLPEDASLKDVLDALDRLARDPSIHGVLVQLPLPPQIDEAAVLAALPAQKDVDGIAAANAGALLNGMEGLRPCTPKGIVRLIDASGIEIAGKHAVVLGRSAIVGKPAALMLLERDATVTLCHSKTRDLPAFTREADILVVSVGRPAFVTGDMVKPGACVIDVGTNRVEKKFVGDVDFASVSQVAGALTPVPGGVGPMTVAMLLENTLIASRALCAR